MTATTTRLTTRLTTPRRRSANVSLRRLLTVARSTLSAIARGWTAFVESGQLGPSAETSVGRHTGARI
jgi:hypothetical protein